MEIFIGLLILAVIIFIVFKSTDSLSSSEGTSSATHTSGGIPISNVLSHWSHFFHSFSISSDMFYQELIDTLKKHEMPNAVIQRTQRKEGGLLSAAREYLRVKHKDMVFDVCAAPFGKDFFISWWLYETADSMRTLLKGTKVGNFLQARAERRTFYQIDEEDMFRSCVHECILDVITRVTDGKGITQLTDADKAYKMGGL